MESQRLVQFEERSENSLETSIQQRGRKKQEGVYVQKKRNVEIGVGADDGPKGSSTNNFRHS